MASRGSVLTLAGVLWVLLAGIALTAGSAFAASAPVLEGARGPNNLVSNVKLWATDVNRSTARVHAVVNPSEADTTYRFEYGPDSSYGSSVPVPDGDVGSGAEGVEVSQMLTDLRPGATYHYRIVATNSVGTTESEDGSFTTFAASTPEPADSCPNAAYRVGLSAGLPDCRAYEMVSPVDKNGGDVGGDRNVVGQTLASEWGDMPGEVDRVAYESKTGFGDTRGSGALGFTQYLAERGPDGWLTHAITPTPNTAVGLQTFFGKTELKEASPDLSTVVMSGYSLPEGPATARPKSDNQYLENAVSGKLIAAVTDASNEGEPMPLPSFLVPLASFFEVPKIGGASQRLDVVTFMSRVNYLPEAHGWSYKAYVYEHGNLKLLGVLPEKMVPSGGSPFPPGGSQLVADTEAGGNLSDTSAIEEKNTVSTDGSRILFEVPEFPNQLFMRKDGSTSILVSESETSEPVTAEEVHLEAASPDLRHILFHTSTRLLDSAPEGGGLYMYTDSPNPESESNLTYIGNSMSQSSERDVLGMSEDGSRIYYLDVSGAVDLWDSGQTRQIAGAPGTGLSSLGRKHVEARVTPDGRQIAFMAQSALAAGSPVLIGAASENVEMYVYRESTDTLKCVSCPPTGAAATAGTEAEARATKTSGIPFVPYEPRFMSRDGRYVFFNTSEGLVPQDTNGVADAYEYDTATGRLSLLSTGMGEDGAWFVDAGADGHDVFIVTHQQLSRWDPDKLNDLYDVRVEGGLPEPPMPAAPCAGDACQGTPSGAPTFNTASGFTGLGNPSFAVAPSVKTRAKPNRRLRLALAMCRKKPKRERARCERSARSRYGARNSSARHRRAGR